MKTTQLRKWAGKAGFAAAFVVGAMLGSGSALAAISATKHNLGANGTGNRTAATDEICVFCHTPHGANTTLSGVGVPLWNKAIPSGAYTTYDQVGSSTLDAQQVLAPSGSVSIACLSCHDGTQALDNLFNAPGSGWGAGTGAAGVTQGWTFTGFGTIASPSAALIGADLRNDHPIGVAYCGGPSGAVWTGAVTASTQCRDTDFQNAASTLIGTTRVWWVDVSGGTAAREKTDMILFTRTFTTPAGSLPSVECASCHDVHSGSALFLRTSNSASGVCLACHVK